VLKLSSRSEIDQLQTDANYYRDRIALLRAKLYRWGMGPNEHMRQLEQRLERTERRLREEQMGPDA
jgi:hypothetical protein